MLKLDSLAQRVPSATWQYALAVVSVGVGLGITDWLEPYTTLRTPLFYIAIISSAWFGGMGPGLLALALSTLAVEYYFAPTASVPELGMDGQPFILLFSLSGLLACWISVQRRRAEEALKEERDKLEARVEERTSDLRRASEGLKAEIAERKRGEDVLRERANLLDLTHDTVFVRDANNVITFWNRGAERTVNLQMAASIHQLNPPEPRPRRAPMTWELELPARRKIEKPDRWWRKSANRRALYVWRRRNRSCDRR